MPMLGWWTDGRDDTEGNEKRIIVLCLHSLTHYGLCSFAVHLHQMCDSEVLRIFKMMA